MWPPPPYRNCTHHDEPDRKPDGFRSANAKKTVDKETALWYKHINLTGKCYLEAVMRKARFSAVMCWDMRCGMRVCFAVPI